MVLIFYNKINKVPRRNIVAKKYSCVLDFGSSKITAMVAQRGVNNTFNIQGTGEVEYAGFYHGDFIEPDKLEESIETVITKAQVNSGVEIDKLYVGVPAEFAFCQTKSTGVSFQKRTKITQNEIMALFDIASKEMQVETHSIINRSPIFFMLDDNRKTMNPNGQITNKLSAEISFIYAENNFISKITEILSNLNIYNIEFISSSLAEAIYLLDPEVRDTGAVLIDCGYITTSVAFVKGDGLIGLSSFSLGGGHITMDIANILKIKFKDAENLKRKVVLSLDASDSDFYEITTDNGTVSPVSAKLTNEIVSSRIDMVASLVMRALTSMKANSNTYLPMYLTGGGLCYLKGGKDYFSKLLASNIEILTPQVPQLNRAHFSSVLGLLDLALSQNQERKLTFKEKLAKFFKK